METKVNYAIVGAFVLVLTAAIILAIIWLSSGFSRENYDIYKVYMKEAVSGLSLDAPVEYNGVNVGTVSKIKINHRNPQLVELLLKVKDNTPVTYGTRAKLEVRALTGIAYIALQDKGTDMRPLVATQGEKYPVINTTPSLFLRIDQMFTQLNRSFTTLANSFHSLLNKENLESVRKILIELKGSSTRLAPLLESSTHTVKSVEIKTLPMMNQAITNFDTAARNAADIATEIKQDPSVLLRGKRNQVLGPGEK